MSQQADGKIITHVTMTEDKAGEKHAVEVAIVPDGREGTEVYVRPARSGEERGSVWIADGETVVLRTEISHIYLKGETQPVRVVLEGREGSKVFVRRLNPSEVDSGETVKFKPGKEEIVLTQSIDAIGLHFTPDVGRTDDMLASFRLVPDGREGTTVYGRTLRHGEVDTGQSVQLRPGDKVVLRPGAFEMSLETIDEQMAVRSDDGYATVTNTLWSWLMIGAARPLSTVRFLLTTARRLDASHRLLRLVREKLTELENTEHGIPRRNLLYEIIGVVEMAVVTLNRALQMASQINSKFALSTPFPSSVVTKLNDIKAIRDAYEHIEDRAFGLVRGKPHPDALSVFNHVRLIEDRVVVYGSHELNIDDEATQLLIETRSYLMMIAKELS